MFKDKQFIRFVIKFLLLFCLFYYGTIAWIGIAAPGGYHSPFVERWLDYVSWIKQSLLWAVGLFTGWMGYSTVIEPGFVIRIENSDAVLIAMDCVGYGVYSFWAAYVLAGNKSWTKKIAWLLGGLFLLWLINAWRITLYLLALYKNKDMPLGIDHHTWFNIVAYVFIFGMIWVFERRGSRQLTVDS